MFALLSLVSGSHLLPLMSYRHSSFNVTSLQERHSSLNKKRLTVSRCKENLWKMPWKCLFLQKKTHQPTLTTPCWLPQVNLWELLTEMIDQSAGGRILELLQICQVMGRSGFCCKSLHYVCQILQKINEFSWFRKPWIARSAEKESSQCFFRWKSPKILGQIGKSKRQFLHDINPQMLDPHP